MKESDEKSEVWQGTLAIMVLKTLEAMGPLHGYGIALHLQQVSNDALQVINSMPRLYVEN